MSRLQGADANSVAPDGWVRDEHSGFGGKSVLHHAAWVGSLPIFKILVEEGGSDFLKRWISSSLLQYVQLLSSSKLSYAAGDSAIGLLFVETLHSMRRLSMVGWIL